ncbi:MAG: protoporphyrinogen oxidase, partial [Nitriliruptoraceae bacterium]
PVEALPAIASALRGLTPTEVTVVALLVASAALSAAGAPVGSGVLVAGDVPGVHAKAMTHASAKWAHVARALPPDHHLLRLSYGGRGARDADLQRGRPTPPHADDGTATDEALVRRALADASALLGEEVGPLVLRGAGVTTWRHGLVRPVVGRRAALDAIDDALAALPDLALLGGAVAGNGLLGVVARSRMEAARTLT